MSLRVYDDIIQGSEEWHAQRRGMVTASAVGKLLTPTLRPASNDIARSLTALLVAERITGHTDPTHVSNDMLRGVEDEPRAVAVYSEHFAPVTTTGFMVRNDWGYDLGYSPDGLVGDDGLIEVKSRRSKRQLTDIITGGIPAEHMAQMQCGLLVSGREWCDYVSYSGGMPLYVVRTHADQRWFDGICAAVQQFEDNAADMIARYNAAVVGFPMTERASDMEIVI